MVIKLSEECERRGFDSPWSSRNREGVCFPDGHNADSLSFQNTRLAIDFIGGSCFILSSALPSSFSMAPTRFVMSKFQYSLEGEAEKKRETCDQPHCCRALALLLDLVINGNLRND